jgi:hypothetical protein
LTFYELDPVLNEASEIRSWRHLLDNFEVKQVPPTAVKPHGLDYSLTLHDGDGRRLLEFDNAHAIREGTGPGARTRIEYDHRHKGKRVRFYDYQDAATLLEDFWKEVDEILEERSTKR